MGWEHVLPQYIMRFLSSIELYPKGIIPFSIQGDGQQTRSFIHIHDMIDAILILLDRGENLNIYHVGNSKEITMSDLAKKVAQYFDREIQIQSHSLPVGSTQRRCPNIEKMQSLGFEPKVTLDEGLLSMIEWYKFHANQKKEI